SGFVYAILAAAFFGVAHTFRKAGLEFIPSSVVGMAVGNAGAFITLILLVPLLPAGSRLNTHPKGLAYYFLTSLGIALALFLLFEGLRLGSVSTVIPLVHTYPLMVILIAWIFLRKTEPITGRLLIGAALIVA
ncbi:MAG: EamA family transporter, partial [bacterium]